MSTITLDDIFQNYLKDSFIDYVKCERCSYVRSTVRKITLTVCRNLKQLPSVLKILLHQAMFHTVD